MDFVYQHDGCVPHRAKSVAAFLDAEKVDVFPWPYQSPDLDPIEKGWGTMKQKLREQYTYPSTADALFQELCKIWNGLPSTYFTDPVSSMNNRCKAIENVRGGSSKYPLHIKLILIGLLYYSSV